jgi:hypothetical protein
MVQPPGIAQGFGIDANFKPRTKSVMPAINDGDLSV